MQLLKKRIYIGEPSPGVNPLRSDEIVADYLYRDQGTLEEGLFFNDCQEMIDHWDDNFTRCGVCLAPLWLYIYEDGREEIVINHENMQRFHQ
jgi:hypothetical protein